MPQNVADHQVLNSTPNKEPIAIIGMGCRFPGSANNPEAFWQLLTQEVDAITEMPLDRSRFDLDSFYDATPAARGKVVTRQGGFLSRLAEFDADFFGISPREASCMDPQQRLLLEVAWEALEDGGQNPTRLNGSATGVFIGMWTNDYEDKMYGLSNDIDLYITTGGGRYSASGRLSYMFDWRGPSMTVDTACSSSLVAIHLACQSLRSGESTLALAGGVNLILEPQISIGYSRSKMLSPDARCKFGDVSANGYVRSEGVGVVVLKRLSQALADKDPIYALIRGSAVNNDGRSSELLVAPGVKTQIQMLREAYQQAGVIPGQVAYVEAHGTGTKVGDPVELEALGTVLAEGRPAGSPCLIGSIKTNIGHTEAASGIAGLIKAALCLKHRAIPASLHFKNPNPNIPWATLPLVIQQKFSPWPDQAGPAYAGVNSFGVTGTNAHIVLQEAPAPQPVVNEPAAKAWLVPLSAHTAEALQAQAATWLQPQAVAPFSLPDIAYSAAIKRSQQSHRLALVVHEKQELIESLQEFLQGEAGSNVSSGSRTLEAPLKAVFVFPGQGSQWLGMGRQLLEREPVFRQALEQCEQAMQPFVDWSLLEQLRLAEDAANYRLNNIDVIQPALLSIEIALAVLWRSWGVEPQAVIGHSMGEVAAAYIAGALSLEEAMRVICRRSQLLKRTSGQGAMAVVELSVEAAQAALKGYEQQLSVAVSNSPSSTVLSGDPAALEELIQKLEAQEVFCRFIKVDVASHSPQMDPLKPDLLAALTGLQPQTASVPIYSTALGLVMDGAGCDPAYWVQNLRQPVLFSKMIQQLLADGYNLFVEMSPHPILLPAVQQGFQHAGQEGLTLSSLRRNEAEQETLLSSLGLLYTHGYPLNWEQLYPQGNFVKLPLYAWQREHFWYEPSASSRKQTTRTRSGSHPLLGEHLLAATGVNLWENELSLAAFPYLSDHRVQGTAVLPAAAYLDMLLAAASERFGTAEPTIEKVNFKEALALPEGQNRLVQLLMSPELPGVMGCQFFSRPAEESDASAWTLHATATVRLAPAVEGATPSRSEERLGGGLRPPLAEGEAIPGSHHYQVMAQRGLQYGPSFQGVAQFWREQEKEITAELQATVAGTKGYLLHPTLLDALFQLMITTLTEEGSPATDTLLPTGLDRLQLYRRPDAAEKLWGYAVRRSSGEALAGDLFLLDDAGQPVAVAYGLQFQRLKGAVGADLENWLYEVRWESQARPKATAAKPDRAGVWLIFAGRTGLGQALADRLAGLGESSTLIFPGPEYRQLAAGQVQLNPAQPEEFRQLLQDADAESQVRGVIHLWSLEAEGGAATTPATLKSAQELGPLAVLHLIQALNGRESEAAPRLWLVTRGAQAVTSLDEPVTLAQAPLWGLGGVVLHEHPELRCVRVDLDPVIGSTEAELLWTELWSDAGEEQVALRQGERYVARLARYQPQEKETVVIASPARLTADQPFRVEVTTPGVLDNLVARVTARPKPKAGEVEIKVHATGLNFMNVMSALGIYPGYPNGVGPLGIECAGEIAAVGEGVTGLEIGQAVVAVAFHSLGSYTITDAHLVAPKPAQLTFEEAATIPIVFLTAYYGLHHLGRMEPGERILIHAAAGGVGLAAIQLAQRAGAEIFATAGSQEKRDYLRSLGVQHLMDSRSLAFSQETLDLTGGEGVDLVLNSLAGEAIPAGLATLRAYGRFLEIGKRDIYQNSQLGLLPFQKSLAYFAIDLDRMTRERPVLVGSMLRQIMRWVEQGELEPIPMTVFPVSEVAEAFRYMAQAKHTGKVVIALQDPAVSPLPAAAAPLSIHEDGAYLITGGLGGLGLAVARWLAGQGARHLALMGRSGASPAAQETLAELAGAGVEVHIARADVAQPQAVAEALREIEQMMPPLRGIIHAAGLLDDSSLLNMDQARFERVTAPKIAGAWNLHQLTQEKPLDFFVLFSSAMALLGTAGQGNYAAANAFLDALAHYRRAQGQPATSLNWGPWSEVGLAAAQANRGERLAQRGVGSLTPEQGLAALARLFRPEVSQVAVMPFNLAQWEEFYPAARKSALFSQLRERQVESETQPQESSIRLALLAVEAGRRRQTLLETHIREQVAQVLRLATSRVPLSKPLKGLGLDSLMTLELRNRLELSLGVTLSATLIWNYPTVAALTPFLADKMNIPLAAAEGGTEPAEAVQAQPDPEAAEVQLGAENGSASLADLSQAEVEALLAEELAAIDDLLN